MSRIREVLQDFNTWWKEEFKLEFKERVIYNEIKKFIPLPQILAFTGLRRVGKTTLMKKIVVDSIQSGFDPKNIIYFSFDDFNETEIREILKEYEYIMEKNLKNGKYMLLLDEIQKIEKWEEKIKLIYDIYGSNIKIIISGSESLFIRKKSKESLAGRIFEFKIERLSFKEFLMFKEFEFKPVNLYENELLKLFDEFILTQGFPELVNIKDKGIIRKYIKEGIVEKIVYKDIPKLFNIRDPSVLESLLNIFSEEPGQIIEISTLSNELGLSRQTISLYLQYLEDSFLLKKLYNFSKNIRKKERKLKKYYSTIISVDLTFKNDDFSKSKTFEWILVNQLNAEFFWRDPYKNEVDIVLQNEEIQPFEIKYGKLSIKGLRSFMKKFKISRGYILSYKKETRLKVDTGYIFVEPAFKFLLKKVYNSYAI